VLRLARILSAPGSVLNGAHPISRVAVRAATAFRKCVHCGQTRRTRGCTLGRPDVAIVHDGSTDQTVSILEELELANLCAWAKAHGGKGSAVQRGNYVLFADADNSTPMEEVEKAVD
jgi:hypothetical protein